jgi:hypothetical protein
MVPFCLWRSGFEPGPFGAAGITGVSHRAWTVALRCGLSFQQWLPGNGPPAHFSVVSSISPIRAEKRGKGARLCRGFLCDTEDPKERGRVRVGLRQHGARDAMLGDGHRCGTVAGHTLGTQPGVQ